jgi:hypothetical protein
MADNTQLIDLFVRNFIQKDRRERCLNQLLGKNRRKFTDDLNHKWEHLINTKLLQELNKNEDNYSSVQQLLKLKDMELCYIISDESTDDTFLPFKDAFVKVDSASFGTLLINQSANKLFLKTEHMQGYTPRFIGIATQI